MRTLLLLLLLSIVLSDTPTHSVSGETIFDTGPFDCDGNHTWQWIAPEEGVAIVQAEAWQGMDKGSIADFSVWLFRQGDGSPIFRHNWDHYAEPTGVQDQIHDRVFRENYFVSGGEKLVLETVCTSYGGPTHGHIIISIWFVR